LELNIEKGKISNLQLILLLTGYLEGAIYSVSFTANLSKHDAWLTVLVGFIINVLFGYVYALLIKRFPGRNLVDIHKIIYGRYLGTAVSLYYLSYSLLLLAFMAKITSDFYNIFFMRETPREIILIVFTCVYAYAVWNGIEVLARVTPFVVTILSLVIFGTTSMLLPKMDFTNFLPIGELPLIDFVHSTQITTEIPIGIIATIFLSIAFTVNDHRRVEKALLSSILLGTFIFMLITIQNTAVLGNTEAIFYSPAFHASRLINIGFLSRLDILFAFGYTLGQFLMCAIFFYITALLLSQILGLRTYLPLLFPLGCIVVILAMIVYPSVTAHLQSIQNVEIWFFLPAMFIFPPLSLLIAKIRNLPKKGYR
jgi:spore germination protein KB